jgi:hypothetical protein
MRRALAGLALAVMGALPGTATAGGLDVRLGAFFPNEESNLFVDDRILYTVDKGDWSSFTGGIEYNARVAPHIELGIHVDGYGETLHTSYRSFVDTDGREIFQTLKLQTVPAGMTLRFIAGGRHSRIQPYLGVGGGLIYYEYEEFGDFIDFDDPAMQVIPDAFISDGITGFGHATGGLRVRLNHDFSLVGEGRYQFASKAEMEEDFRGNSLDLNGWSATIGVHVQF